MGVWLSMPRPGLFPLAGPFGPALNALARFGQDSVALIGSHQVSADRVPKQLLGIADLDMDVAVDHGPVR